MQISQVIAQELKLRLDNVEAVVALVDEGATLPFIARYRKEVSGGMDEDVLRNLMERLAYLRNLEKRKAEVLASIEEQGKLTDELRAAITGAVTLAAVEDIYRPYKQKRKTRASVARERCLEPLALLILAGKEAEAKSSAADYIDAEKGVADGEAALQGAMDIVAEVISDEPAYRETLRRLLRRIGLIASKGADGVHNYRDYLDFSEPVAKVPHHRILALNRGEKEGILKVSLAMEAGEALPIILKHFAEADSSEGSLFYQTITDSWKRLLFPSLEREIRTALTEAAESQAINVFAQNLQQLLLQPPVAGKRILALDPAFRTGCKLAVLDETGKVLTTGVIFPTPPQNKVAEARQTVAELSKKYQIDSIVIGNGTACRETESFVVDYLRECGGNQEYIIVNEAGASVYSASKLAKEELPDLDVSYRGAVSIGRRIQDPLAELVKIDPKAIGVGQYQHDVDQKSLQQSLDGIVEICVNKVGVDVNTASPSLLSYVSGLNKKTAQAIVAQREAAGGFAAREELRKVKGLGDKTFQQCAGFLRIRNGKDLLDNTAVHPESYHIARDLIAEEQAALAELLKSQGKMAEIATAKGTGVPTLRDIVNELLKPGRDMREELPKPVFRKDVLDFNQLEAGLVLDGVVRNVVDFGAFVDIGVHQDGMVHISQLANRFIRQPSEVVKVGDNVRVKVLSVDTQRKRIALTMRDIDVDAE
jgi:uncharacterized protein